MKKVHKKFFSVKDIVYIYIMSMSKKIKNILFFASNVIKTPALIYHEIWHLLMCIVTRTNISRINIQATDSFKQDFSYSVGISVSPKTYTKNFLIAMAPFIGVILAYFLCLYTESIILFTYCFFCNKVFMPSEEDFATIDNFKTDEELLEEMLRDEQLIEEMLRDENI